MKDQFSRAQSSIISFVLALAAPLVPVALAAQVMLDYANSAFA
ncbi:hypothetical protein [Sphingomonas mali]|nr:hypothetical protein [Sphingomonas mali]